MSKPSAVPARPACYQTSQVTSAEARRSLSQSHRYGSVSPRLGHSHGHTPGPSPYEVPRLARLTRDAAEPPRVDGPGSTARASSRRSARHPVRAWPSMPHPELAILRQGSGTWDLGPGFPDRAPCSWSWAPGLHPPGWAVSCRLAVVLTLAAAPRARSLAAARGVRPAHRRR
jgi:hypothetical protein